MKKYGEIVMLGSSFDKKRRFIRTHGSSCGVVMLEEVGTVELLVLRRSIGLILSCKT